MCSRDKVGRQIGRRAAVKEGEKKGTGYWGEGGRCLGVLGVYDRVRYLDYCDEVCGRPTGLGGS